MFSMKGRYIKGEDLTKLMNGICDMRVSDKEEVIKKRGKLQALVDLNLINEDQEMYALEALDYLEANSK